MEIRIFQVKKQQLEIFKTKVQEDTFKNNNNWTF